MKDEQIKVSRTWLEKLVSQAEYALEKNTDIFNAPKTAFLLGYIISAKELLK